MFFCLFVLICVGINGCNPQGLRDSMDNRIGQIDAPPELRE